MTVERGDKDVQARTIVGIILYAAAIAAPTAWLYVHHGLSAPVDTGSIDDLVTLAGTAVVAFVLGLIASKVSQPDSNRTPCRLSKHCGIY